MSAGENLLPNHLLPLCHGTLHHLLEVVYDDCLAAGSAGSFKVLLQQCLEGIQCRSMLCFASGRSGIASLFFPLHFNFARDPNSYRINVSGAEDGFRTLAQHYMACFAQPSYLKERVLVSYDPSGSGDCCYLLSQHLFPYGCQDVCRDSARVMFNRHVLACRQRLHSPRMKLLLLAHAIGSLQMLSWDLVNLIGKHLLDGPKDAFGHFVPRAGEYASNFPASAANDAS